ncbi:MAG: DUF2752 domain-containing protein [Verrucomicrobiota bacterium]
MTGTVQFRPSLSWLGVAAVLLLAAWFVYAQDPVQSGLYPVCLFHRLTGLDCPGCGSSRALHALAHGRVGEALRDNLALCISILVAAGFGLRHVVCRMRGAVPPAVSSWWLWGGLAMWLVFGVARNLPVFAGWAAH